MEKAFIPFLRKITGSSSQSVWFSTSFTRSIGYNKVEPGKEFRPTDLYSIKALGRHKVFHVAVIGENLNRGQSRLEFGTPFFETSYNSHEFFVIYLIVALGGGVFLRIKGYGVEDSLVVVLGQYFSGDVIGGIGFNNNFLVGVEMGQEGGGSERVLSKLESLFAIVAPEEFVVLPDKGNNRGHDVAVFFDESPIQVCKT